jgi:hypothetical protein
MGVLLGYTRRKGHGPGSGKSHQGPSLSSNRRISVTRIVVYEVRDRQSEESGFMSRTSV